MPYDWTWNVYRCIARNGEWDDTGNWVRYQVRINTGTGKRGMTYHIAYNPTEARFAQSPALDKIQDRPEWTEIKHIITLDAEDAR